MRPCGEFFVGAQLITRPPEQKLFGPVCRPRDHLLVVDPGLEEGRGFSSVALFASSARHRPTVIRTIFRRGDPELALADFPQGYRQPDCDRRARP
jgi:hypothetical protein